MSSVRPKLKPETPKTVTAWETASGRVVYLTPTGRWSPDPADLAVFTGEVAEAALASARAQEGVVTDPYLMEVSETGAIAGRETLRETIRAAGPTIHPEFAKAGAA